MKVFMLSKHSSEHVNKCFFEMQQLMIRTLLAVQKVTNFTGTFQERERETERMRERESARARARVLTPRETQMK